MSEELKVEMPLTDMNQITRSKNKVLSDVQTFYRGYLEMAEMLQDMKIMHQSETRSQIDALKGSETTLNQHLETIRTQEEEIRSLRKSKHEYETMIRDLQDKLHEKQSAEAEETEQSNKFSMMRLQAKEITEKDREIERLNRLLLLHKNKKQGPAKAPLDGGWSPTKSKTPRQAEEVEAAEEASSNDTNDKNVIDHVLSSVSDSVLKLEKATSEENLDEVAVESVEAAAEEATEEEVAEATEEAETEEAEAVEVDAAEEATEEVEAVEEATEDDIQYEEITYRKKKYLYDPKDDTNQLYEWLEGSKAGKIVGTWGTTKSGRKKPLLTK